MTDYYAYRMIKDKFEEDDGIDMNDIERFLPHLHSVSLFPSCLFSFMYVYFQQNLKGLLICTCFSNVSFHEVF